MTIPKVAVIGGGVSGLAVAYYVLKLSKEKKFPIEVSLYEASERFGGVIDTERVDGFVLEKGPDSFITEKPWALELARELGLESEIIGTNAFNRRSFIAHGNRLLPVPEGFYLVAPLRAGAFLRSPIVSWSGKMRMAAELFLPGKKGGEDESLASFIRRRFGQEALERVAQPMIAGIYTGDPEKLSLRATMPLFFELEQKYGSLTRGLLAQARNKKALAGASGPRYSLFASFRNGMGTFSQALQNAIPSDGLHQGFAAETVARDPATGRWHVDFALKGRKDFDAVCMTTRPVRAGIFLKKDQPALAEKLSHITYESVATVNLAYRREDIAHPLNGFGFVIPRVENKTIIACSFSSQKFEGRAPQGHVLLRAFTGGAFGRHHLEEADDAVLTQVESELGEYLGLRGKPRLSRVERYPGAMVQYNLGHGELIAAIRAGLPAGLFLAGAAYDGVGIPDCVRAAKSEAHKILQTVIPESFNRESHPTRHSERSEES